VLWSGSVSTRPRTRTSFTDIDNGRNSVATFDSDHRLLPRPSLSIRLATIPKTIKSPNRDWQNSAIRLESDGTHAISANELTA
jgi:hypothetical protein